MYEVYDENNKLDVGKIVKLTVLGFTALLIFVALCVAGSAGCAGYNRYQKRADANNRVKVTSINIRNAQQQAKVVAAQDATIKAQADQRVIAAIGIRHAQDEISKTLTDKYIQWEAIQAQLKIASSGQNNTVIYVPAGANGVPLVQTPPTNVGIGQGK